MNAAGIIQAYAISKGGTFRKRDILLHLKEKSYSPAYINVALNRMMKGGALLREGRGQYRLSDGKKEFAPHVDPLSREVAAFFKAELPFARYCLYEGEWINPFMHHVAGNHLHYVEVERDAVESVFERLSAKGYTVYLRPDREFIYRYVDIHNPAAIVIKPLISESPLIQVDGIPCPALEKILVDISKDPDFDYLQGAEYRRILGNVKNVFHLNEPRLLRYASRRSVREQLAKALEETDHDID